MKGSLLHVLQRWSGSVSALWCESAKRRMVQATASPDDSGASPEIMAHSCSQCTAELWVHLKKNTNSQLKDSLDPMYLVKQDFQE